MVGRRRILGWAAAAALPGLTALAAHAEEYPARPVRVIVGFAAGGGADILTRLVCDWLQARLGQPFVVDNRPGAATNLATEAVVRAPADGYTLLATTTSNLINGALFEDLKYEFARDIAPVALLSIQPLVLAVTPSLPARSLQDFIAHARAHPGQVNFGNTGAGTISHLAAEAFKAATGIDAVSVPYRGAAPMLPDLLAGRVQATFDNLPPYVPHIRAGNLRALAVTTAARSGALPDVPAVNELVRGYEAYAVAGIGAPRGTPMAVIERLNAEINAALADPAFNARLAELGGQALPGTPADFGTLIARESEKWGRLVRASAIKVN